MSATVANAHRVTIVDGRVIGSRCSSCSFAVSPPLPRCPRCGGEQDAQDFPARGRIWASALIHLPVLDRDAARTRFSYVDIENGPRVLAAGDGPAPESDYPIGAAVILCETTSSITAIPVGKD
ncbi:Zn-ribbon domain-containing OB-fold protein [Arthrobacter ginsengisoli]|uniref:Zn-ribbon domain-containing OB-fold protein n=1 Tax=Arthrobacter ginsengisoli TaxID=1356565 RepID=UPI0035B544D2